MTTGDRLIQRHLQQLKMRQTERSVYARKRALCRMSRVMSLETAQRDDLMQWRESIQGLAPSTIAGYVAHANEWFAWLIIEGIRLDNPALGIPVPRIPRRLPRPMATEDLMRALELAPREIRMILVLAAWVGMRAKEIAYLRRGSVLDRAPEPSILIASDATKGYLERLVSLCEFALAELLTFGLPTTKSAVVIPRWDGAPGPNMPWVISHRVNDFLHDIGIDDTLHCARHWFATELYRATGDIRLVQEMLGHARITSTTGYTLFHRPNAARAVATLAVPDGWRSAA